MVRNSSFVFYFVRQLLCSNRLGIANLVLPDEDEQKNLSRFDNAKQGHLQKLAM